MSAVDAKEKKSRSWANVMIARERDCDLLADQNRGEAFVRIIRGQRCKDEASLFGEWAAALQFPYYFGDNWNAFRECINDLSWAEASKYSLYITQAHLILAKDPKAASYFYRILQEAVETWSKPVPESYDFRWTTDPVPFSIVFQTDKQHSEEYLHELGKLGVNVPVEEMAPFDDIL